jgi:ribosome-associated translation inhibitor RaiA
MQTPLQIAFEGVDHSATIETWIREEAKKLDHMGEHITSARVVVATPRNRHYTGDPYRIRIHLLVPGGADINVNHDPGVGKRHGDNKAAIQDAFRAAHRQLEDVVHKRQGHVKAHKVAPHTVGDGVQFSEETGDKGQRASFVRPLGKQHIA